MPRPIDSPPASSPSALPDGGSFLCERIQQFRQRMRSRCVEAHRAGSDDAAATSVGLPCLLQSWRKRIEVMDDHHETQTHRHRGQHIHRRPHYSATSSEESDASSSSPPSPCAGFPFRGPRMLHPRLERQRAVCSLSGIWSGFTSSSPPPSPEIYAKPRHRRHPYSRCCGRETDDHGESSPA